MGNSNRLLVVIDPREPSDYVVQRAIELALHFDVHLELFASYHKSLGIVSSVLKTELFHQLLFDPLHELHATLEKVANTIRAYGITVTVDAVCDAPLHEAIVRKALRDEPRWVIKDAHHHGVLHDIGLDNTDWNLIRECPCPLWLVRSRQPIVDSRILAAVDPLHQHDKPTALDQKILSLTQFISDQTNSEVHVLHAYDPSPAFMLTPGAESAAVNTKLLQEQMYSIHSEALEKLVANFDLPDDHTHLKMGPVRATIRRFIDDNNIELVVMGAIARNPLKRIFIGSSAEEILRSLPCDILVVKPDWFVSNLDRTPYVKDLTLIKDRKWGLKCE